MCGICGKLYFDSEQKVTAEQLDRMMGAISHRGPDGQGKYLAGPVGMGHTRLAIIDLSTGRQPMANENEKIWLVYNGEVYNFHELREELIRKGHIFRSSSDTEVIIHLYEEYGTECASRLRGMFAFSLWDDAAKTLFLARDRVGIKPLYYVNTGKALVFASEIKALLCDAEVLSPQTSRSALILRGLDLFQKISADQVGEVLVHGLDRFLEVSAVWP